MLGDKQLFVGRFQKKNERQSEIKRKKDMQRQERMTKYQGVNLYIKNLDDAIDDERLKKEFSKFGTITSARVRPIPFLSGQTRLDIGARSRSCLKMVVHEASASFASVRPTRPPKP